MNRSLLLIFTLLCSFASNAQRNYSAFDILNGNIIVPPNGILINDNVFLDDSEVMNSHYLEYLHFLAQDSSEAVLLKAYPDTTIFGRRHLDQLLRFQQNYYKKKGNKHIPVSLLTHDEIVHEPVSAHHWWNYFSFHGTKHFPVVGISYEQALAYSKWRSVFVTHLFNEVLKKKRKYKSFENQYVRFEFSLPDERLWEVAAQSVSLKISSDTLKEFNVKTGSLETKKEPTAAFDKTPTSLGFYNLIGNVAEMMIEKGTSKGGSYLNSLDECLPNKSILYNKPERWLGFRCLCKVMVVQIASK